MRNSGPLGFELGHVHRSNLVISEQNTPIMDEEKYIPAAYPGMRAPHVWLNQNGKRISILDLFGLGLFY